MPLHSSCKCSWALYCPSLCCSRLLTCSVRLLSKLPCCLLPRCHPCLGSWALLHPLCDRLWGLCCMLLCRSWSLLRSECLLPVLLRCLLLCRALGSAIAYPWACGCSSASRVPARGHFTVVVTFAWACGRACALCAFVHGRSAACRCTVFVCSRALCVVSRGWCATSSVCFGAPLLLTPRLAGARVPLVRCPARVVLPCAPPLCLAHLLCALFV